MSRTLGYITSVLGRLLKVKKSRTARRSKQDVTAKGCRWWISRMLAKLVGEAWLSWHSMSFASNNKLRKFREASQVSRSFESFFKLQKLPAGASEAAFEWNPKLFISKSKFERENAIKVTENRKLRFNYSSDKLFTSPDPRCRSLMTLSRRSSKLPPMWTSVRFYFCMARKKEEKRE